uniref:Uncharacterized protein n=1 Tax=Lepeophtheirus salmonis TaxID=72036 RepID=A0A0K2V6D5_LEPSM
MEELDSADDGQHTLKWPIFPHREHSLPYAGHFTFWKTWLLPQNLQFPLSIFGLAFCVDHILLEQRRPFGPLYLDAITVLLDSISLAWLMEVSNALANDNTSFNFVLPLVDSLAEPWGRRVLNHHL